MASPEVAGVAALMLSFNPKLAPFMVKGIIMETSIRYPGLKVNEPGSETLVDFSSLSVTGGIANAFEAVSKIAHQK